MSSHGTKLRGTVVMFELGVKSYRVELKLGAG